MLACFASQREALRWFRVDHECIRPAPHYDFTRPAHDGPLFYDSNDWGLRGSEWLDLAAEALARLRCPSR